MARAPAFQFYPKDFLTDTGFLTPAETGAYVRLMCYAWKGVQGLEQGRLPLDHTKLARMAGVSLDEWEEMDTNVLGYFDRDDDGWTHPRLMKERRKQEKRRKKLSEAGKKGARIRHGNKGDSKGGHSQATASPKGGDKGGHSLPSASSTASTEGTTTEDKSSGPRPVVENSADVEKPPPDDRPVNDVVAPIIRRRWWQSKDPPPQAPNGWNLGRDISVCKRLIGSEGWTLAELEAALEEYEGPPATLAVAMKEGNRHVLYRLREKIEQRARATEVSRVGDVLNDMQRRAANA